MASANIQFDPTNDRFFAETAHRLYGKQADLAAVAARWSTLAAEHKANFGVSQCAFYSSPGRIELCGNHTDHQHGKVLCASIDLDTLAAVTKTQGNIAIKSGPYPLLEIDLGHLELREEEKGTSLALVKGVARYYIEHGLKVGGFVATMTSNVAKGSGVSSSASFECCVAEILNILYNNGVIDPITKAKASQWAECEYFGKPCGLLDQCAIALGGVAYIDFADPASPAVHKVTYPFDSDIILVNSGGDHSKLTDCYSAIRTEMQQVARVLGGEVLGEVTYTPDLFDRCKRAGVSGRAVLRALHFFAEQGRVDNAVQALKTGDDAAFYAALNASGESSDRYLQNTHIPNDPSQYIPFAVEYLRALGALCCRVHGGGFAGTVLGIFAHDTVEDAYRHLVATYGEDNIFRVHIRPDGATYTFVEATL